MFHVFMNLVCTLACLVLTELQGFAVTPDVAMLGTEVTVLVAALHVSLTLHAFGTFMTMVFRMCWRHGLRKGSSTGDSKQPSEQGVFGFHGVAPLELSCVPTPDGWCVEISG
ncbi:MULTISPECIES: hypothetical protein [Ralstonia]|jgi:hypothetical protein|uniref:hypothetical protein n=1 Tax=Ralstonia TaxID=48736 RepID=UPI0003A85B7E|nr:MULTISPECIES: hypothetical protein [Ralstonia]MBL4778120.1 hypothetical protein [Ralstonia sp.]MCM3579943.1 hypothetical protein [Ralstonia pickettii]MDR9384985.1 hypothetical protein [Ralstonia sp. 11b]MEA3267739.1 hypothetical protein [Pseudomonadota bacterium]